MSSTGGEAIPHDAIPGNEALSLRSPVAQLPGVGPSRARLIAKLGLRSAADLLFFFPRNYELPGELTKPSDFVEGEKVTVQGEIVEVDQRVTQSGKHMLGILVDVGETTVRGVWFNQSFRAKTLIEGARVAVTGSLRSTGLSWELVQPSAVVLGEDESIEDDQTPLPVYGLTEGLKQHVMRHLMKQAVVPLVGLVPEVIPAPLRDELNVVEISRALSAVHFPTSIEDAEQARRRLKLQELFVLQLAISMQRKAREENSRAFECSPSGKVHARIMRRLPHQPTADQITAIDEIRDDMGKSIPMNRLLQGDVGSGKTVVAQYAMLLAVASGCQAALMAPTEVLANQHVATFNSALESSSVRIELLTSSMTAAARRSVLEKCREGEVDLLIGTQSLLSDDVQFKQLGLVVVDEQHKFGVMQRAKLRTEDAQPHYLVLSATPIPRTIAMSVFGDLDVSTIRTKPPGRAAVHTYTSERGQLDSWWKFLDRQLDSGRQAYVIAPRVADNPASDGASAESVYKQLSSGPFQERTVGLLHGRMESGDKDAALTRFASGETQILVATTVVEVGIDVPNACVMTILDADRLGLSQLHQLRGRVGRGSHPGYVNAVASEGNTTENQRLVAFEATNDGFELAEKDLQMRGPGDLLGTSQSGLPPLRVASLVDDGELLEFAKQVARRLLEEDPQLENDDLRLIREQTLRRYGERLQLGDVG